MRMDPHSRHQYTPELSAKILLSHRNPDISPVSTNTNKDTHNDRQQVRTPTTAPPSEGCDTSQQASSFATRRGITNISPLKGLHRAQAPSSSSTCSSSPQTQQENTLAAQSDCQLASDLPVPHLYQQLTGSQDDNETHLDECRLRAARNAQQRLFESTPASPATYKSSTLASKHLDKFTFIRQVQQLKWQLKEHSAASTKQEPNSPTNTKETKHLAMATVRPISPQYQHTLDSAISLAKELASRNMADSGESSPKTPNSPDKKRFNFKLKHFSKSYSEASANIRDIESSISDEAKLAYKSLVERGPFNSYNHSSSSSHSSSASDRGHFGSSSGFHNQHSPRALYENDNFSLMTPPASAKLKYSGRGGSTFSIKKSFF